MHLNRRLQDESHLDLRDARATATAHAAGLGHVRYTVMCKLDCADAAQLSKQHGLHSTPTRFLAEAGNVSDFKSIRGACSPFKNCTNCFQAQVTRSTEVG